jgi:RNA polymerase sigma factor (sigma-70 family)
MNPEDRYLQNLRMIERIAAFVARRHHLEAAEAEEFVQEVRVRLLDDDYAIIRKFEGRSTFSTYLTTVIGRLFSQCRVEQWGKWRPSAEAKRLGEKAVTLERLITRDGYTFAEAVAVLTTGKSIYEVAELEAIYELLPPRNPRPVVIPVDGVPDTIAVQPGGYERIAAEERARAVRFALKTLHDAIARMDPEDRLILRMRYWDKKRVPDIAQALHLEQKKLYKRLERLMKILRAELESAGVSWEEMRGLLDGEDDEGGDDEDPS